MWRMECFAGVMWHNDIHGTSGLTLSSQDRQSNHRSSCCLSAGHSQWTHSLQFSHRIICSLLHFIVHLLDRDCDIQQNVSLPGFHRVRVGELSENVVWAVKVPGWVREGWRQKKSWLVPGTEHQGLIDGADLHLLSWAEHWQLLCCTTQYFCSEFDQFTSCSPQYDVFPR